MTVAPHAYGWRPSLADLRDIPADTSGLEAADEVDPRTQMPAVYDQGQLGSCTANAVAGALQYDAIVNQRALAGAPSRLWLYYEERRREGTTSYDAGAYGRDGFKVAKHEGVPLEQVWPYVIGEYAVAPPQETYVELPRYRIDRFTHVHRDVNEWKRVLSNQQTIAFGFTVYESFESEQVANTGVVPMPSSREQVLGGHEVLAVGYLASEPNYVLCRNSWGPSWGQGGYFLMPWEYIMDPNRLASDFRTIPRGAG